LKQLNKLSQQSRLVKDAGLSIENRIAKLKKENRMVNLKPYQVYKHFKVNKIKRKTIQEVYPNQNRRYLRNNDRFLEV
jgi:hypothetical protein